MKAVPSDSKILIGYSNRAIKGVRRDFVRELGGKSAFILKNEACQFGCKGKVAVGIAPTDKPPAVPS